MPPTCSHACSCQNKHVHMPVLAKFWPKMWTPPRQRRISEASSPYSVASSRLELQLWSPMSVQSSPDRAVAQSSSVRRAVPSDPPFAEVPPAAVTSATSVAASGSGCARICCRRQTCT